ncbi:MAG: hypothetical protein GTO54_04725, partial [Nitrososphaeria archaeon]|nr:hypothetical protein [Nitrososphaeria archaeon]
MAPRKNDKPSELEDLYDSDLVSDNFASRKVVAQKAVKHVTDLYDHYRQLRRFRRGGKDVDLVEEWNQRYRM